MRVVTVLLVDLDVLGEESWRKTCGCEQKWKEADGTFWPQGFPEWYQGCLENF